MDNELGIILKPAHINDFELSFIPGKSKDIKLADEYEALVVENGIGIYKYCKEAENEEDYDDDNRYKNIGYINFTYLDALSADMYSHSLSDLFDYKNEEISGAYGWLCENDEIKEEYKLDIFCNNAVYIDNIYIKPEYRNKGIGTYIVSNLGFILFTLLKLNVGCVFLSPLPYELDGGEAPQYIRDDEILLNKLKKFYRNCGFKQVSNSDYYYLAEF